MADDAGVFLDTNVLVYAAVKESPFYEAARRAIGESSQQGRVCWVSRQVIREFLVTLTRPDAFSPPVEIGTVLDLADDLERRFQVAEDGANVTRALHDLLRRVPVRGKKIHDANIVATMLANGIRTLLTHNAADFDGFSDVIELRRLETSP